MNFRWNYPTVLSYRDLVLMAGYEAMHMIQKGQVEGVGKKDVNVQIKFDEPQHCEKKEG